MRFARTLSPIPARSFENPGRGEVEILEQQAMRLVPTGRACALNLSTTAIPPGRVVVLEESGLVASCEA